MKKHVCDYCGKKFDDIDGVVINDEQCCNECLEICEICGDGITPGQAEAYMGRCIDCCDKDDEEGLFS